MIGSFSSLRARFPPAFIPPGYSKSLFSLRLVRAHRGITIATPESQGLYIAAQSLGVGAQCAQHCQQRNRALFRPDLAQEGNGGFT